MSEHSTEEIARAAVSLCADLLRRYAPYGRPPGPGYQRTGYESDTQINTWVRQVLAWQDQLDLAGRS